MREILVQCRPFPVGVRLEAEGVDLELDDNVFDIDGGSARGVTCTAEISLWQLRRKLRVRSLR